MRGARGESWNFIGPGGQGGGIRDTLGDPLGPVGSATEQTGVEGAGFFGHAWLSGSERQVNHTALSLMHLH